MPNINPDQFDNYRFETVYDPDMNVTASRASVYGNNSGRWHPVASMKINGYQRSRNESEQQLINAGLDHHGIGSDPNGQLKWTGGMMNDSIDKVSWLGMDKEGLSTRDQSNILKGMFGTAVQTHGSIPHADNELSEAGSRISKAMNRRYGLKPHPRNPTMEPNLSWLDDEDSATYAINSDLKDVHDLINNRRYGDYKEYSNEEVADSVQWLQGMAGQQKPKKMKKRVDPQLPGMED